MSVCLLTFITWSCLFKVITLTHRATQMKHTCLSAKFGVSVNSKPLGLAVDWWEVMCMFVSADFFYFTRWLWKAAKKGVTSPAANNIAVGMCSKTKESFLNKSSYIGDWQTLKVFTPFSLFSLIFLEDVSSPLEDYKQEHGKGKSLLD